MIVLQLEINHPDLSILRNTINGQPNVTHQTRYNQAITETYSVLLLRAFYANTCYIGHAYLL